MIVFDLQGAQSLGSGNRGIGRYTRDLATALATRHPGVIDHFSYHPDLPIDPRLFDIAPSGSFRSVRELDGAAIDLFHITSPFEHVRIDEMLPIGPVGALVATCYDLIPLRFQDRYLIPLARSEYLARLNLLHTCDAILTDSASAADDCVELLGIPSERLTVIGGGTNACFQLPTDPLERRLELLGESMPEIRAGFVLVPTGMDWRKNIEGAIAAYAALPASVQERHQLVIGCKVTHHERRLLERWVAESGCVGDVVITGFTSDDDLVRLYQSAEIVFFPSRYEGFGLPVLEARRCGARVICSNVSSLPEVMPLDAATFDPWSVDDMARHLLRALTDAAFAIELDEAPDPGFTFEVAADRTVEAYERVLAARHRRVVRRRPRVAFVTVLPPTPSGVADHSTRLLDELCRQADVTCFVVDDVFPPGTAHPYAVRRLSLLPALATGGAFDAVVYAMGNNELHRPFLDLMQQVPGHVLFHEVRLSGCYTPDERHTIGERHYADREAPLYAAEVAAGAVGCLVQSAHAAELLAADTGRQAIDIGPHAMHPADRVGGDDTVQIVSLGIADIVKQTHKFVDAADRVLERRPEWSAAIVGLGGSRFVADDSRVVATDRVDDAAFDEWLARATVLVQLRDRSNGESSGVIAHALSYGIPIVTTDIGAIREIPDDAIVKVPRRIDPDALADVIEQLVADRERRAAISAAAQRYARANTYRHQAERLLAAVVPSRRESASVTRD